MLVDTSYVRISSLCQMIRCADAKRSSTETYQPNACLGGVQQVIGRCLPPNNEYRLLKVHVFLFRLSPDMMKDTSLSLKNR